MAGPLTRQAQNEALVRFGPQRFALRELLQQAVQARDMNLHAAAGAERGIQAALAAARGSTAATYSHGIDTTTGTRGLVADALSKIGAAGSPFAAAIAREQGDSTSRLAEGQTNALQELTQRSLEAASGRAFATQHATDQFTQDIGKIQRSYQELASEQGAFTQGRVGELRKEQADRLFQRDLAEFNQSQANKRSRISARTQRRSQDLSHADRQASIQQRKDAAAKKRAGNRIGPHGPKLATQEAHTALWQAIQGALPDAKKQKSLDRGYGEVANLLTNGRGSQSITDPQSGQKLKVPGIAKRGRLAAIVAADYAFYGGITQHTLDILHSRGFSVRDLKLKRAPRGPAIKKLNQSGQDAAQVLANALKG